VVSSTGRVMSTPSILAAKADVSRVMTIGIQFTPG
jgi:hypothetical protein